MIDYLLIGSFLLLTLIILIVIIYLVISKKLSLLVFIIIPILLANVILMGATISSFRGYAVDVDLPEKFTIHFFLAVPSEQKIYLFIQREDKVIRLHKVPYSEKLYKDLEKAKEATTGQGKEHLKIKAEKKKRQKTHETDIQLKIENPTDEIRK